MHHDHWGQLFVGSKYESPNTPTPTISHSRDNDAIMIVLIFFKKLALKLCKSFSIVRDQHAFECIKYYIQQNPKNRKKDCFSG